MKGKVGPLLNKVYDFRLCSRVHGEEKCDMVPSNDDTPGTQAIVPVSNAAYPELFPTIEITPQVLSFVRHM